MKKPPFTWKTIKVLVSKIKNTPNNFKLKTEEGTARFNTSVGDYGLAGTVILNADFTLIDGNTRLDKAKQMGERYIEASMPNKKLTPKQFTEFAALFDLARAGEVDVLRIKQELGTTKSFFEKWGLPMPELALNKLAELEENDKIVKPTSRKAVEEKKKEMELRPVTLLFTGDQAKKFIEHAEALYKQFRVDNVTDLCYKLLLSTKRAK